MSTRSSTRNLFPPLDNPELTIRRRSHVDLTLLNDFEMDTKGNGNPPVPDLRTMEEFIKVNGVTDDVLRLYLFPHSLTHHATAWFDRLPRNSISTFDQMAKMFLGKYFPPSMVTKLRNEITNFSQRLDESLFKGWERYKLSIDRCGTFMKRRPEECYDLIKNMTAHQNDWDTSSQRSESSSSITSSSNPKIISLKAKMAEINKNLMKVLQINQQVKAPPLAKPRMYVLREPIIKVVILTNLKTNMTSLTNSNLELKNMFGQFMKMNTASSLGSGTLPSSTVTNPKEDLKGITTRIGTTYQGPTIPTTFSSSPQVVKCETKVAKDTPVVAPIIEPVVALVIEPVVAPVSASKPNQKPSIPYSSRLHDQKLCEKANDQKEKFFQIFKDLYFNISFADALILMPRFGLTIKSLLTSKEKLFELARTPLNEHCSVVLLKKLPEKLGHPGKFLIPCDFLGMDECLALANLGASINLMPLSVWNKLSLPELTPTLMTLELTDRSISRPIGVTKDVFVKTGKALIDVYEGELTLRVGKEAVTFNLEQTSRYSANYNDMTANQIDVINMACEDDFLLEKVDAFFAFEDDPTSPEVDHSYYDTEGDILLLEAFLNDDPSLPPPTQGMYLPELKICEAKNDKSSIDDPPEVELKDLPPHLEYVFLEGDDKLPIIIAKDLSVKEKSTLIKVLKSHKQAIAWKLSDIKSIILEFCTHKILMEDDFEPAEKSHFMVKEGIVLGHKIFKNRIELDKAKVNVIAKLPHPTTVKGPFLSSRGNKYILVAVDYLSKWVKTKELLTNDARVVCKFLKSLFARFRTPRAIITFKTPIGYTPYKLVYEKACHLPTELEYKAYWALKHCHYDLLTAGDYRKVQLNELNELRDQAYENSLIYKEKTNRIHDSKTKTMFSALVIESFSLILD
nr:reverse transcriptase domain-containing protein [Tanacetum cinerariifolium]